MDIRSLQINGTVMLAPMAGFTDPAFRILCTRYGSSLNFTEMISAKAVLTNDRRSRLMTGVSKEEGKIAVQLFGDRPEIIARAIQRIEDNPQGDSRPVMFDLNAGCPVKKVLKKGSGSRLLRSPELLGRIVRAMRNTTELPISVKIRLGWEYGQASDQDHVRIGRLIEDQGADLLIVHGRYRDEDYSGKAHWDLIREVVNAVDIPVVGNGDVRDEETAERMFNETGCASVMVGRAAQGNPYIFRRLNFYLSTSGMIPQKSRVKLFEEYMELARDHEIMESLIKKQSLQFARGMHHSNALREKLKLLDDPEDILEMMRRADTSDSSGS